MIEEDEEQFEYDVFYRGTKENLYAFLYPLTGPSNPIFDHLNLKNMRFIPEQKSFEATYEPKDFENIDKQKQEIIYKSTVIPTQSNYFYSVYEPDYKCFLWQNVRNFVEMRPKNSLAVSSKQKQPAINENNVELNIVEFEDSQNKAKQIIQSTIIQPMKENWEVSKDEYLSQLAK